MSRVKIKISGRLSIKTSCLSKRCLADIKHQFTYKNPQYIMNERAGRSVLGLPPILKSYKIKKRRGRILISRGCLSELKTILKRHKYKIQLVDKTIFKPCIKKLKSTIVPTPDQQKALDAIVASDMGGIVLASTSYGKTVLALMVIEKLNAVATVIVWNKKHQMQWYKEILKFSVIDESEIGGAGGIFKTPKVGRINLVMQQSIAPIEGRENKSLRNMFAKKTSILILEETQIYAAKTFDEVVHSFKAKYRLGISASITRKDNKEFLIYNSLGDVLFKSLGEKSFSKIPCHINLVITKYFYNYTGDRVDMVSSMMINKARNKIIVDRAVKKIKQDKLVLIMVERKVHAAILTEMLRKQNIICEMMLGSKFTKDELSSFVQIPSVEKFLSYDPDTAYKKIIKLAQKKKIQCIIGNKVSFVGFSIKTIDHAIITMPASRDLELFNQQVGRVERSYSGDKKLLKRFGTKQTPTVDYIADIRIGPLRNTALIIKNTYPRKIKFIR